MKHFIFFLTAIISFSAFAEKINFQTKKIIISKSELIVEIADTPEKQQLGLMYRKTLPKNNGMLFIFRDEKKRNFWMKNTFIPLTIGFFDQNKKLVETIDMKPTLSEMEAEPPSYSSQKSAQYALEVNLGWFKKNNIKAGDKFHFK